MREVVSESFEQWRDQARNLLRQSVPPDGVHFVDAAQGQPMLAFPTEEKISFVRQAIKVPREFLSLAQTVSCFRDSSRWALLYRVLWRIIEGEFYLLQDHADPQMRELRLMEKAVRRDIHKMRAFVRFREAPGPVYIAWYRPEHLIVLINAPFFVRRFGAMNWSILTPEASAYWDQKELRFGPGVNRDALPQNDDIEDLWLTYYSSIFNPARANYAAMIAEMPASHWETLPESKLIRPLLREAEQRVMSMASRETPSARPYVPVSASLEILSEAVHQCRGCDLHEHATQPVFGVGPASAKIMMIGEQPGDQEDREGTPFIGPAGQLLNQALEAAGIERNHLYITNAVKHFRFETQGNLRRHLSPTGDHLIACRPWLEAEIAHVQPKIIVCLGASAAQTVMGRGVRIHEERGKWLPTHLSQRLLVTVHPSALLRMSMGMRRQEFSRFVGDLQLLHEEVVS